MSFATFWAVVESSDIFDADEYARDVARGQALAAALEDRLRGRQAQGAVPEELKRALVQAQLVAAIDDPLNVLRHLSHYLALNGDYWAAGKLHGTYNNEAKRRAVEQSARRKGAHRTNRERKSKKTQWIEVALRVGRRIRETTDGARLTDSALARKIVDSREFISLGERCPSWHTVRAELRPLRNKRMPRARMVSRRSKKKRHK